MRIKPTGQAEPEPHRTDLRHLCQKYAGPDQVNSPNPVPEPMRNDLKNIPILAKLGV
jgi:hypothetical protein